MWAVRKDRRHCLPQARVLWQTMTLALTSLSGAMAGKIQTSGNIAAVQGSTVTLNCTLTGTNAKVAQVIWKQCENLTIAVLKDDEENVKEPFRGKFARAEIYGITIQSVEINDSGYYCCVFTTYPDGGYDGKVFLEVTAEITLSSVRPLVIALPVVVLIVLVLVISGLLISKTNRSQLLLRSTSYTSNNYAMSPVLADTLLDETTEAAEQEEAVSDVEHDYFNVLPFKHINRSQVPFRATAYTSNQHAMSPVLADTLLDETTEAAVQEESVSNVEHDYFNVLPIKHVND